MKVEKAQPQDAAWSLPAALAALEEETPEERKDPIESSIREEYALLVGKEDGNVLGTL